MRGAKGFLLKSRPHVWKPNSYIYELSARAPIEPAFMRAEPAGIRAERGRIRAAPVLKRAERARIQAEPTRIPM